MTHTERWSKAQDYEKDWWNHQQNTLDLTIYQYYAEDIQQFLQGILSVNDDTYILEIGSGPVGILTFLKSSYRYALDPLEHYYSTVPAFVEFRDPHVHYHNGKGEQLPFPDAQFDFIIMDNVLDHCENPDQVMKEMTRVLKPNGIVFFRQNVYHHWGAFVRWLMEFFEIDRGHPFTFTRASLQQLLKRHNLSVVKIKRTGYFPRWKKELTSGKRMDLIKALLLVNRDRVSYVLKK